MTRTWEAIFAAVIVCVLLAAPASLSAQVIEFEAYPLEPPDTTSPRDTLRSFLRHLIYLGIRPDHRHRSTLGL